MCNANTYLLDGWQKHPHSLVDIRGTFYPCTYLYNTTQSIPHGVCWHSC